MKYSIPGLQKWLHRNGFSYKQPKGVPHKYDQEKQDVFIEEYNELKATVASDEPILFMDASHPTQATKVSSGWIRTGVDKPIETTGRRYQAWSHRRCNYQAVCDGKRRFYY